MNKVGELYEATIEINESADGSYTLVVQTFDGEYYYHSYLTEASVGACIIEDMKDAKKRKSTLI